MSKRTSPSKTRSTASTVAYERIKHDILTGRLDPGLKLRIDQIAKRYEVGTSPIREALNRLYGDGFVNRHEQRGFSVANVSVDELRELTKTRIWLESTALREAMLNPNQTWEDAIVLALHRLSRTSRSLSETGYELNPEWEQRHSEFHEALIANCGSNQLIKYCRDLRNKSDRYRLLAATYVSARRELDEHRAIFEAAIAGTTDRALELLASHYTITQSVIEKRFIQLSVPKT